MKIAAQLYTLRDRLRSAADFPPIFERLREIGYEAVEIAGIWPSDMAGMVACAAHVGLGEIDQAVPRCKALGCRYVVVPSLPLGYQSPDGFRRFATEADVIAAALRKTGLELGYHNHDFELSIGFELLFAGDLLAELDTFWLKHAGADPVAWIQRLSGRVPLIHLKDMAADGRQTEVGEGILDWPAILSACRGAGTEWLVVEQDEGDRDPMESLEISYQNLVAMLC